MFKLWIKNERYVLGPEVIYQTPLECLKVY